MLCVWLFLSYRKRVVVSLSTIPSRVDKIQSTIDSIWNQSYKPTEIALNIPWKFKRKNEEYDESKFPKNVTIYRCEDLGPATKFVPTALREDSETIIIYIDDDAEYQKDFIENLVKKQPGKLVTESLSSDYYGMDYIVEGVYGVCVDNSLVDKALLREYIEKYMTHEECISCDDYVISQYFKQLNVPRDTHGMHPTHKNLEDALHLSQPFGKERYEQCKKLF